MSRIKTVGTSAGGGTTFIGPGLFSISMLLLMLEKKQNELFPKTTDPRLLAECLGWWVGGKEHRSEGV